MLRGIHMSKYALKFGQSAVERLAVLDEIHAVTSSHILSGVSLPAPSRILDVGCGVGHTTIRLARHFGSQAHVVGIDREPSQIDTSKRSEEHTSELQSLMRISYAVFCLKKKNN